MNDILNEFDIFFRTRLDYWKKQNLSYSWYWFLAVFFGWLGLDHFYLGSPIAGVMKIVLNVVMLGWPWFYDAMNATMNQDHIKLTGPINPVVGPLGIGAGRFASDPASVPASHKNMLIYGLVVILFGVFGADSFLVGDKLSGYLRIILLFTFFFTPVAIIWWLYKLYLYFIRTDQLLDQNYVYFDAPKPSDPSLICPNVLEQVTVWFVETLATVADYIPIVNNFVPMIKSLAESLRVAYGIAKETAETVVDTAQTLSTSADQIQSNLDPEAIKTAISVERGRAEGAEGAGGASGLSSALSPSSSGLMSGGGRGTHSRKKSPEEKPEDYAGLLPVAILAVIIISFSYISLKIYTEGKKLITGIMRNNKMKKNIHNIHNNTTQIPPVNQYAQRSSQAIPDDSP